MTTKTVIFSQEIKINEGDVLPEINPDLIGGSILTIGFLEYFYHEITKFDVNFRNSMDDTRKDITFCFIDSQPISSTENLTPDGFPTEITGYNHGIIKMDIITFYTKIKEGMTELRVYQIGSRYTPDELSIDDIHGLAEVYHETKGFKEAIKLYEDILGQIPDDVCALINIGLAHVCIKEYQRAIDYYKTALEVESDDSLIWYNLGIAHEGNGNIEAAKKAYLKAQELDPEDEEIKKHIEELMKKL